MKDNFVSKFSVGELVRLDFEPKVTSSGFMMPPPRVNGHSADDMLGVVITVDEYKMVGVRWVTGLIPNAVWYVEGQLKKVVDSGESSL